MRAVVQICALFGYFVAAGGAAYAQVSPAATGPLGLSVFAGPTGAYTGLHGQPTGPEGRNLSGTAGLDFELPPIRGQRPSAEVRGTYPFHPGYAVGEKNVMGGLRDTFYPGFLRPAHISLFGDILFGWGRLAYQHGGFDNPAGTFTYFHTSSFVFAPGAGGKLRLTSRWALQGDVQFEHYSTPVTSGGSIWAKAVTGAVVYRLDRFHTRSPWSSEP